MAGFSTFAPHLKYALSSMFYPPRILRTIPKYDYFLIFHYLIIY